MSPPEWEQVVVADGTQTKATKRTFNTRRTHPPSTSHRSDLLATTALDRQPPLAEARLVQASVCLRLIAHVPVNGVYAGMS
nr:hypothetical protein [Mycobacterium lepromatosis]